MEVSFPRDYLLLTVKTGDSALPSPSKKVPFSADSNVETALSVSVSFDDAEQLNKSFYTSTRLSEILHDLPPDQFERAIDSCVNLRIPPALAANIQRLGVALSQDEAEISVHRQSRNALKFNLEILPDHLGPNFQRWYEEGKKLLSPNSEDEDDEAKKSDDSVDKVKSIPLGPAEQNELTDEEKVNSEPSGVLENENMDIRDSLEDRFESQPDQVPATEYHEQDEGVEIIKSVGEKFGARNDLIYPDETDRGNDLADDSGDACVILENVLEPDPDYLTMLDDSNSSGNTGSIIFHKNKRYPPVRI
ncbi:hypothetical protein Aperf_G00000018026 [Anoplocephala perfoliata]